MSDTEYTRTDRVYIDEAVDVEFYRQLKKKAIANRSKRPLIPSRIFHVCCLFGL
jgi:hypothetical protein